jgi:hypothetical protein
MPEKKPDKTRNERQARRRAREKKWLADNGFSSWEAVHTILMRDSMKLVQGGKLIEFRTHSADIQKTCDT